MAKNRPESTSTGTVSYVGLGGGEFGCDKEGCNNFRTKNLAEHNKHLEDHRVLSGAHECMECGELVVYQDLDEKDRPTMKQIDNKLVFHPKCAGKFFKDRGLEVKQIK